MSKYSDAKELAGLTLGQKTEYANQYDASLLQPVPRSLNRDDLALGDELPFIGHDIWTMYELSWLNDKGLPQVAVGEVFIPATSPNLIESKSFKLYLNSFNMSSFASKATVKAMMEKDLALASGAPVVVQLHDLDDTTNNVKPWSIPSLDGYELTEEVSEEPDTSLLQLGDIEVKAKWQTHLFRSLCPVTAQPDWASVRVEYQGKEILPASLLTYLVSFRTHQGFHEQCVEQIFRDLIAVANPNRLLVEARFMRRGGLDINPMRMKGMFEVNHQRLSRQ